MTVHLQWIGEKPGKRVDELRVGDVIMWNGGATSEVLELTPTATGKSITATLRESGDGRVVNRQMRATRYVAMAE